MAPFLSAAIQSEQGKHKQKLSHAKLVDENAGKNLHYFVTYLSQDSFSAFSSDACFSLASSIILEICCPKIKTQGRMSEFNFTLFLFFLKLQVAPPFVGGPFIQWKLLLEEGRKRQFLQVPTSVCSPLCHLFHCPGRAPDKLGQTLRVLQGEGGISKTVAFPSCSRNSP